MRLSQVTFALAGCAIQMANSSPCIPPPLEATAFALTYGYPIRQYSLLVKSYLGSTGPNVGLKRRAFYPANTTEPAIRVNVDTLYITGYVDLSSDNVIFTYPEPKDDRFYSFTYFDLYGNNIATLASSLDSTPGKYMLRPRDGECNDKSAQDESVQGYINSPTTYGFFAYRFWIKDKNNATELDLVHAMQDESTITPVPRTWHSFANAAPALTNETLKETLGSTYSPSGILNVLARISATNPPIEASDWARVNSKLSAAGLSNGIYTPPADVDLSAADSLADALVASALASPRGQRDLGNGWEVAFPETAGNFSTDYEARSYLAQRLYGLLTPDVALYPAYVRDTVGDNQNLVVGAGEAYLLTFSGRPPLAEKGFWSITAYDENQYLIPNGIDVQSLGSASNMTYPDGEPIYRNGREYGPDGQFQILLQPAGLYPPANWTSNWLPVTPGGGEFTVTLRWYAPHEALMDGSYEYPIFTKISAITP